MSGKLYDNLNELELCEEFNTYCPFKHQGKITNIKLSCGNQEECKKWREDFVAARKKGLIIKITTCKACRKPFWFTVENNIDPRIYKDTPCPNCTHPIMIEFLISESQPTEPENDKPKEEPAKNETTIDIWIYKIPEKNVYAAYFRTLIHPLKSLHIESLVNALKKEIQDGKPSFHFIPPPNYQPPKESLFDLETYEELSEKQSEEFIEEYNK